MEHGAGMDAMLLPSKGAEANTRKAPTQSPPKGGDHMEGYTGYSYVATVEGILMEFASPEKYLDFISS